MNKFNRLKEIIEEKIGYATVDLANTFNRLLDAEKGTREHDKTKKEYWKLAGEIEAYYDLITIVEVLNNENKKNRK